MFSNSRSYKPIKRKQKGNINNTSRHPTSQGNTHDDQDSEPLDLRSHTSHSEPERNKVQSHTIQSQDSTEPDNIINMDDINKEIEESI